MKMKKTTKKTAINAFIQKVKSKDMHSTIC